MIWSCACAGRPRAALGASNLQGLDGKLNSIEKQVWDASFGVVGHPRLQGAGEGE